MCVLDRYIGKTIFTTIMMTLFLLVSLSSVIKFVEQMRHQGNYSAMGAFLFTLLSLPKDSAIFFPMASLIGALLGLGSLATSSELLVMQASGFSQMQVAGSVMKTTMALVLLHMVIGELVAPTSEQIAYNYRTQAIAGGSMLAKKHGLWAKDGDDFIFIERMVSNNQLAGVNIYQFDQEERLQSLRYAATANFSNGSWKLSQVEELDLTNSNQINVKQTINVEWKTHLTPARLRVIALAPHSLAIYELDNYVNYLKQSGQNYQSYQLKLWSKMFSPLSVLVMMLVAMSLIFGPLRSVPTAVRFITGISCSFLFHVLDQIFGPLSIVYNIPPLIGALLPSMLLMIISIVILFTNY